MRVRIMRLRATHISGPPPRFKVTLLIVEARTASSCQMKCDYLAQTWTVKDERKINLTKFFFGVAVGPLYISSKLFPYFSKEKFSPSPLFGRKKSSRSRQKSARGEVLIFAPLSLLPLFAAVMRLTFFHITSQSSRPLAADRRCRGPRGLYGSLKGMDGGGPDGWRERETDRQRMKWKSTY